VLTTALRGRVGDLWDVLWHSGISNSVVAMQQIGYLLFLRRLEGSDEKRRAAAELQNSPYKSIFASHDECRWSHFIHLPPARMLPHLRDHVFPFVRKLSYKGQKFSDYMKDAAFAIPSAEVLAQATAIIEDIYTLIEQEQVEQAHDFHDTHGDIYDHLLSEIDTAGKGDRFHTPQHIIQLVCELVDPKLEQRICDPACGTGGFLVGAYRHILTQHTSPEYRHTGESGMEQGLLGDQLTDELQWEVLKEKTFHGFDFDGDMARIGLMNLILHGIGDASLDAARKEEAEHKRFDVVLANPPFVGDAYDDDLHDEEEGSGKHESHFVRQIFDLLKVGGRAGVIVPMGALTGTSQMHQDMRRLLVEECALKGIICLPSGVFQPYTDTAAAILIFTKGGHTRNVWYYDMRADGYSLDGQRRKVKENDLPDAIIRWKKRNPETDTDHSARAFFVPAEDIRIRDYELEIDSYREAAA